YYIGGVITEREKLFLQTPASFGKRFNIDVRVENEVTAINSEEKIIEIQTKGGSTYSESYDKLLLSPGSIPVRPPLQGIDSDGVFTLRNVEDTDQIKNYIHS
ncbi:MAG: FAD-dependent oxidoreductase, partial [Bacteroidales bacterium]